MNYAKPEVAVLGKAVSVIEHNVADKSGDSFDGTQCNPAYDLDE
jgi:hypothetical protein